jgi:ABC-type oligopeptide transport system substrate-binding subunit
VIFRKSVAIIITLILIILSFCGCKTQTGDYTLYIETDDKPSSVDPQLAQSQVEEILARNMFEGLMRLDSEGNVVKGVAESVEISQDGLTYTFKIKDEALWSDGSKVTADDFVFGMQRALNPETKSSKAHLLFSIKNARKINLGENADLGVKAVSENTLKIYLEEKNSDFVKILTTCVSMPCSRNFFAKSKGKYGMNDEDFISNGSYRLKSWAKDGEYSIRIVKNSEYKGDFVAQASAVNFTVGEKAERFEKLSKNSLDLGLIDYAQSDDKVTVSQFSKTCYALLVNPKSAFGIADFKKALALSLDRQELKNSLPKNLEYTDKLLPDVITKDGKSLNTLLEFEPSIKYNPTAAKEAFLNGVKNYNNPGDATIVYFGGEDIKSAALSVANSYQKTLGIVVNIKQLESEQVLKEAVQSGEYQLAIVPISAQSDSVVQYFNRFHSENGLNIYGFSAPHHHGT